MHRRTYLATLTGVVAIGGCVDQVGDPSPTATETDPLVDSGADDYPHEILVDNSSDREITLTITVDRGETQVYDHPHTVAAQTEAVVAGFTERTLPEDSRSVTITATDSEDQSTSVTVNISNCLGDIIFTYDSDGTLESTYSIC